MPPTIFEVVIQLLVLLSVLIYPVRLLTLHLIVYIVERNKDLNIREIDSIDANKVIFWKT